jgi:predicted metalloprotease with PDZ domain
MPARSGSLPAWLGMKLTSKQARTLVVSVRSDGPAYAAGITADDELLALDGFRISEHRLQDRLSERRPGDTVTLSLFRRDELLHVPVTLAAAPYDTLKLLRNEQTSALQDRLYSAWLPTPIKQ